MRAKSTLVVAALLAVLAVSPGGADAGSGGGVEARDSGPVQPGVETGDRRGRCRAVRKSVSEVGSAKLVAAIRCLINRERSRADRPALGADRALNDVARRQVRFMIERGCFGTDCGPPLKKRVEDSGYPQNGPFTVFELIAKAPRRQATAKRVVAHWLETDRKSLMRGYLADIGVGVKQGLPRRPASKGGTFVAELGCRCNRPAR